MRASTLASLVAAVLVTAPALAQQAPGPEQDPGTKIHIDPASLPKPRATPGVNNTSAVIARSPSATLRVPQGFAVNRFAENLPNARNLAIAPNGDVFLAESDAGRIVVLRDAGDGKGQVVGTFAEGFRAPYGMAFHDSAFYVGDLAGVWRIPYTPGDTKAREKQTEITEPGAMGSTGGHFTRNIVFSPDGKKLYAAIGSAGNLEEDPAPRATVQVFDMDEGGAHATNERTFASGLRNAVGVAFYPGSNDLYASVNERDMEGDELVPDYFTKVVDGGFYGWPYSYIGHNPQPGYGDKRPDLVAKATVPEVLFRSHSAPLGFTFSTGTQFPAAYKGGAFVALHGSWNSAHPRGYMVVYVPFSGGKPSGDYEVFASGFWAQGSDRAQVMGRPCALAVAKDGSLLIADDSGNMIWRVSYGAK